MSSARQAWLVAVREMRERSRSRAFLASLIVLVLVVAGIIVLPAVLSGGGGTKDVGLSGATPSELPSAIRAQSNAVDIRARLHRYDTVAEGQDAVRAGTIDVLVVDGNRLEWRHRSDEQLRAVVTGAIQLVAVRERAAAAGISPDEMIAIVAPVPVRNLELGRVEGRSPDDETAAFIMTVLLFMAIATYGSMVLTGVVEEKATRVVEVLLARMPARSLLAGKIAGIGLLGLGQIVLTALVALAAITLTDSFDIPAVRGAVLAWVVVWFVLGYALYATVFGALGSLTSRPEDAQSVAGPISAVLIAGYLVSFAAIGSPSTAWAKAVSYFPATAPLAMPNRIAMGATSWWEPVLSVAITLGAIAVLVYLGGRVFTGGALHSGATLKLRDAWRSTTTPPHSAAPTGTVELATVLHADQPSERHRTSIASGPLVTGALIAIATAIAAGIYLVANDGVIGIAVGAAFFAIASRIVKSASRADRYPPHQ